ncbi:MAG: DNA-binding response regulator [Candidatus Margulisiibacteriota bacterium]|nr:MAG: DNA-binding response regulator [Candidatus Margulisbacteria bacterium GWD2_39_127]OGI04764.1 MAG: DNA-binding response regulator [Candidatus Margulisbacteria bacterium GWF2_38_17]OGI05709.1 MAG: DNA-binding response regulator [Candidatus Margulisbacteria bacterium GWE2_39_32]PZM83644.1 MAG: DNA-binding response regulator [Candidatus Margulisiibacteriota bacterium]HAR62062.1 DNA-binding response regulator [Candidatus Margulisiibacteriota bacterium]
MKIKILMVDDHKIMREGLRALLEKESEMEVISEAENGRSAVDLAAKLKPNLVIMDASMADLNGIEATRQIIANSPAIKVLGLSMYSDRRFVTGMLSAGASGYILKDCAFEELITAIHTVFANQIYLSPGITTIVIKDYVGRLSAPEDPESPVLTTREREVLQLLAEGKTTKQIATLLYVSTKTIETYRQQIMKKLNIHSVAELTKYAIREGLTSL